MNAIFGSAGFAREVDWLIEDIYGNTSVDYRPDFFVVEEGSALIGDSINLQKVISESEFFKISAKYNIINCFVAVGNPETRKRIVNKIKLHSPGCCFPNLIHPNVSYDTRPYKLAFGEGIIVCSKSVLTTDISLGNFIHINLNCTVGHDSVLGDFSTISPGVHISGNVQIAEKVFIGTGAVVLEKIAICSNVLIGAGSVVTKNVTLPGTYVGCPARKIR
jgi:sugar O-acyltransferase (sialic acid O-acetyltransferase NeuD family)